MYGLDFLLHRRICGTLFTNDNEASMHVLEFVFLLYVKKINCTRFLVLALARSGLNCCILRGYQSSSFRRFAQYVQTTFAVPAARISSFLTKESEAISTP